MLKATLCNIDFGHSLSVRDEKVSLMKEYKSLWTFTYDTLPRAGHSQRSQSSSCSQLKRSCSTLESQGSKTYSTMSLVHRLKHWVYLSDPDMPEDVRRSKSLVRRLDAFFMLCECADWSVVQSS